MRYCFAVLLVLLFCINQGYGADTTEAQSVHPQTRSILKGTVIDIDSKQPLPDVTVQAIGTGYATKTNREGNYRLLLPAGTYRIKASHIGHYSVTDTVNLIELSRVHDFSLKTSILDMGEVKVYTRAYDPGQRIILEAIAHKDDILSRIHDYEFKAYTKLVITDETQPDTVQSNMFLIAETQLTSYWEQPDKYKEIIQSRRQSANLPAANNLVNIGEILNFNKNRMDIGDYSVVSPTADDALKHYNYYLVDTEYLDSKPVFVLEIEPKNEYEPLFVGEIYIADSTYEVVQVDVGFSKSMENPFLKDVRYYQRYAEINGKYWMPIEIGFTCDVHVGKVIGALGIPSRLGLSYVASLGDYKIDEGVDEETFDGFDLVVAPGVDDFDSTIWFTRQVLPLTREEEIGYAYIDSLEHAPKPFLKQAMRVAVGLPLWVLFGNARDLFHYNRVDGYYFGFGFGFSPYPNLNLYVKSGYGIKDDRWQYFCNADYILNPYRRISIGGSILRQNVKRTSITYSNRLNETYGALLFGDDPNIYYQTKGFSLYAAGKPQQKTSLRFGFNRYDYSSLPLRTNYSVFGDRNEVWSNMSITEGRLRSLWMGISYDSHPLMNDRGIISQLPARSFLVARAGIEYSSPDFAGSDFDFRRYAVEINGKVMVPGLGIMSFFGYGGTSEGNLPAQKRFVAGYMDLGIYQTMGLMTFADTCFAGDRMVYLFAEHDFGKYMFRNSHVGFLKTIPFGFSVHGGAMWSGYRDGTIPVGEVGMMAPRIYSEIGVGLHNLTPWLGIFNFSVKYSWQLSHYRTSYRKLSINFFDF